MKVLQTSALATWLRRRIRVQSAENRGKDNRPNEFCFRLCSDSLYSVVCYFMERVAGLELRDPNLGKVVLYQLSYTRVLAFL